MTVRAVHWHEGMFLRPHHMQAALRNIGHQQHQSDTWDTHYNWGIRDIFIDPDALANQQLIIRRLRARLRDGTLVTVPEDGELPVLDLSQVFATEPTATVYLAVPTLHVGRPNLAGLGHEEAGRYHVDSMNLEDENTGLNPQPVELRRLNVKLLLGSQDHTGFEVLPLMRLERASEASLAPKLDDKYIPPVLGCDAWAFLQEKIIQGVHGLLGGQIKVLSERMISESIAVESQSPNDIGIIERLRTYNECYAVFHILGWAKGVHPLEMYTELCRTVGKLSLYLDTRKVEDLPRYDHDDLGACFFRVRDVLRKIVEGGSGGDYVSRPFVGTGPRMQVAMEPTWLEPQYTLYVGIKSSLPPTKAVDLWTQPFFDMKIGSSHTVDRVFEAGGRGIMFDHVPNPPRVLSSTKGVVYFEINRQSEEWVNVTHSLSMAIRVRDRAIVGDIEGQKVLNLRTPDGEVMKAQFTLYVLKS